MIRRARHQDGFSLVEMLVSLALFTIVAVIAVGTLLVLIGGNTQSSGDQAVMTSLAFAMDSMTREIRTGTEYYCGTKALVTASTTSDVTSSSTATRNCSNADGISFREAGGSITGGDSHNFSRIAYYFDSTSKMLWRQVGDDAPQPLLSDDIIVNSVNFFVTGATPLHTALADISQPMVTIVLDATAASSSNAKTFTVQTTVTQRQLDI
jgi:prepilin-type N-terminal cleavage/methylation domain-containing protein